MLDDARATSSPLHPVFEWDDTRAAEMYREDQARYVIRCIRVVTQTGDEQPRLTRAFVNVIEDVDGKEQHGYVPMARILSDADLFRKVVGQAAKDLRAWEDRYAQFTSLAEIGRVARERVEQLALQETA